MGRIIIRNCDIYFSKRIGEDVTIMKCEDVNSVLLKYKAIRHPNRDSKGRTRSMGYDCDISFNVMQNDNFTLKAWINFFNFSDSQSNESINCTITPVEDPFFNFTLEDVKPLIDEGTMDGDGKASGMKIFMDKILSESNMAGIISTSTP